MHFGFFYTLRYYAVVVLMTAAIIAMWYDGATDWNDGPNTIETLQFLHGQAKGQPAPDLVVVADMGCYSDGSSDAERLITNSFTVNKPSTAQPSP